MSWLAVWMRAVIVPATQRAVPVWLGAGIVGAVIFGGTGMAPHDLTQLALRTPAVAVGVAVTWLLLFVPTARLVVRDDATRYLRALPHAPWPPRLIGASALVGLQLPWLVLWLAGEHVGGVAVVLAFTPILAIVALWRGRPPRRHPVTWHSSGAALFGVYLRALRRRAADALLRAAGLALLAGGAAGLFVRNNELAPTDASVLATAVIAIVLVPGWAGALLPLVDAHRSSAWLASSLGISERARVGILTLAIAAIYVGGAALAILATAIVVGDPAIAALLAGLGLTVALALALLVTRAAIVAERTAASPAKLVIGVVVASAIAVILLGWLGTSGVLGLAALGLLAVGTT